MIFFIFLGLKLPKEFWNIRFASDMIISQDVEKVWQWRVIIFDIFSGKSIFHVRSKLQSSFSLKDAGFS